MQTSTCFPTHFLLSTPAASVSHRSVSLSSDPPDLCMSSVIGKRPAVNSPLQNLLPVQLYLEKAPGWGLGSITI